MAASSAGEPWARAGEAKRTETAALSAPAVNARLEMCMICSPAATLFEGRGSGVKLRPAQALQPWPLYVIEGAWALPFSSGALGATATPISSRDFFTCALPSDIQST